MPIIIIRTFDSPFDDDFLLSAFGVGNPVGAIVGAIVGAWEGGRVRTIVEIEVISTVPPSSEETASVNVLSDSEVDMESSNALPDAAPNVASDSVTSKLTSHVTANTCRRRRDEVDVILKPLIDDSPTPRLLATKDFTSSFTSSVGAALATISKTTETVRVSAEVGNRLGRLEGAGIGTVDGAGRVGRLDGAGIGTDDGIGVVGIGVLAKVGVEVGFMVEVMIGVEVGTDEGEEVAGAWEGELSTVHESELEPTQ